MKFLVFLFTIFLPLVECLARKRWYTASYKSDNDDYWMEWSSYLKKLSLITFIVTGAVLYYLPNSRIYFYRGCHEMIDLVADGLRTALDTSDAQYFPDDSSSVYSHQELEENSEKEAAASSLGSSSTQDFTQDGLLNVYIGARRHRIVVNSESHDENQMKMNRKIRVRRRKAITSERNIDKNEKNYSFGKFSTKQCALPRVPVEAIEIYPDGTVDIPNFSKSRCPPASTRDSDTSSTICHAFNESQHGILYADDDDNSGLDGEPKQYPDKEPSHDCASPVQHSMSYLRGKEIIGQPLTSREKFKRQLVEFDRTLRNLCCTLQNKNLTRQVEKDDDDTMRVIETILRSVKSSVADIIASEKRVNKKYYRKSKGASKTIMTETARKLMNRKSNGKTVETEQRRNLHPIGTSMRKNVHKGYRQTIGEVSLSRDRCKLLFLMPEEDVPIPVITNRVKPILERAVGWFCGRCSGFEHEMPAASKEE